MDLVRIHKSKSKLGKLDVWSVYSYPKKIANINKPKTRCGRNRAIKSIANRTSGEKSDEHPPDYILNRKAKFIPIIRGKFGFFVFVVIDIYSAGCRSPPISIVFDFSKNEDIETEDNKMNKNGKVFIRIDFGVYEEINYSELISRCAQDISYRNKLFYPFDGILMEVTQEEYAEFYRADRRQKYLRELSELHRDVSYNALDTDEMNGEEAIIDDETNIEHEVELSIMTEKLYKCLALLMEDEYRLIYALFCDKKSEREYAAELGIYRNAVHKRKNRILSKLKKLLEN